jgi:hypothetical protein
VHLNISFHLLKQFIYLKNILIEKNEMGGACSKYGGEERRMQGLGGKT